MKRVRAFLAFSSGFLLLATAAATWAQPEGEPTPLPAATEVETSPDDLPPPPPDPSRGAPPSPAQPGAGQPGQPGQPGAGQPGQPGAGQPGYPPPPGYGQSRQRQPAYPPPPGYGQQPARPPAGYGSPGYYGYGPPPPPPPAPAPPRKGIYRHDGFYARIGVGIAKLGATVEPDDATESFDVDGTGATIDMALGGSPVDGFVLGGRIVSAAGRDPAVTVGSEKRDTRGDSAFSSLQLFTDVYPWPDKGLHVLGAVGPATFSYDHTHVSSGDMEVSMGGLAYSLGVGWEGWVGPQWSIGGMVSLNAGSLSADDVAFLWTNAATGATEQIYAGKAKASLFVPTLSFEATFH